MTAQHVGPARSDSGLRIDSTLFRDHDEKGMLSQKRYSIVRPPARPKNCLVQKCRFNGAQPRLYFLVFFGAGTHPAVANVQCFT